MQFLILTISILVAGVVGCGQLCYVKPSSAVIVGEPTGAPFEVSFQARYTKGYIGCGPGSDFELQAFEWDFDGDGLVDASGTSPTASHVYTEAGEYLVSVAVIDRSTPPDYPTANTLLVRVSESGGVTISEAPAPAPTSTPSD